MSFDLSDLNIQEAAEAGAELELVHPINKTPLGIFITLLGTDSVTYQQAQWQLLNKRAAKGKFQSASREQIQRDVAEILAQCTTSWRGMKENKVDVPFSRESAIRIYGAYGWIREQIDEFMSERSNYLRD